MKDPAGIVEGVDAQATRCVTPCGEGRMVWRIWGDGPQLLLLHGGHGSWTHWIRAIPELSRHFRVIAPDLPGLGESDMPPEPYSAESLTMIVAGGLDEVVQGESPLDIAGFSFGAIVAGHLAILRPAMVHRLVLVGAGGLGLPRGRTDGLTKWRRIDDPERRLAAHRGNLEALMIHDPANVDDLAVHLQFENTRRARLRSRPIAFTDTLRRALSGSDVPLAGIWGQYDATVGSHMAEYESLIHTLRPGAEFRIIGGAGHWVAYEAPQRFVATLLSVLGRAELRS
ncbi:alpha/beta fold hydrolase [bacterium]|nr:MAG: alpha/beta fold hydrolase [bacterium]